MTDSDHETGGLEPPVSQDDARAAAQESPRQEIGEELAGAPVAEVHSNIEQTVITVDEDKVKLALGAAVKEIGKRRAAWAPGALFVGLMTSLLTADFKEVLGVNAQIVEGIVITFAVLSGAYTVFTAVRAALSQSRDKVVQHTISKLKGQ